MKHGFGLSIPETLAEICAPEHCALILYDMQVGIVPQIASGMATLRHCQRLLVAARSAGVRVFFTRHLFLPHRAAGVGQLRRSMIWQQVAEPESTRPFLEPGSAGVEIVPELAPEPGEVVVDKITMSAFEGTFLHLALRDLGVRSYVIAGIALEIGIEPTVRHSLDLDFIPVLVPEACGSKTEELHSRSMKTLSETGEVVSASVDEVEAAWKGSGR